MPWAAVQVLRLLFVTLTVLFVTLADPFLHFDEKGLFGVSHQSGGHT